MKIIREAMKLRGRSYRVSVRTNSYNHSLAHFQELFMMAKADYPSLLDSDVEIVQYSGDRIKHIHGLEFNVAIPTNGYDLVNCLEDTL